MYPHVSQIENEKIISINKSDQNYKVTTKKNVYHFKIVILALNYAKPFTRKGLEMFIIPHETSNPKKDRIQLKNKNHLIKNGLYCFGTIAGYRRLLTT